MFAAQSFSRVFDFPRDRKFNILRMKKITITTFFLIIILFEFCSCSKDLSREQSITLINAYHGFLVLGNSPRANSNAQFNGYEQGFWDQNGYLTGRGAEFFSYGLNNGRIYLKQPVVPRVSVVTGITNAISPLGGEQQGMKEVQFQWEYTGVEGVFKRFIGRGGTGVAYLRLYDDGWRVEKTEIQENSDRLPLDASDQAQIEKDRQVENSRRTEEANRIAEENRKIREIEEMRALLIERSKTSSKELGTFSDIDAFDGKPRSRKILLTDVKVEILGEANESRTIWFGDLKSDPYMTNFRQNAFGWNGFCVIISDPFSVVFKDESECKRFYQAITKAIADWRAKYPELVINN